MNTLAIKLIIKIWNDDCPEDPCSEDGWSVYSFSRRHANFRDPDDFDFESPAFEAKLKAGLAFPLSYFEHGQCIWSLEGTGPQCRWDSVTHAGFIVWEQDEGNIGAATFEDRRKDATAFIERYTLWCNGEVYGYTVEAYSKCPTCGQHEEVDEDVTDFDMPSVGGYYSNDFDYMLSSIKEHIGDDWKDYEVEFKEQDGYGIADEFKRRWTEEA